MKKKIIIIISSHFDLILLFFAENLQYMLTCSVWTAENAAFPNDLLGINDKKIMEAQKNFVNTRENIV
jgi:hypothetical protein